MALISALQASLLLTEEQRATHTERHTHTHKDTRGFLTQHQEYYLSNPFHTGKYIWGGHYLLIGHSYGNLWLLNNNKSFSAPGFYDYSVDQSHTAQWTKHIYYLKCSHNSPLFYHTSVYSMFPCFRFRCELRKQLLVWCCHAW